MTGVQTCALPISLEMTVKSILEDTKQALGIASDYTPFDQELILHINSAIMMVEQLGLPPFYLYTGKETWSDYLGASEFSFEAVKSLIFLRVRLIFDPPQNSFVTTAIEKQIEEYNWRIVMQKETIHDV